MASFTETINALSFPKFGSKECNVVGTRIIKKIKNPEEKITNFVYSKYPPFPKSEIIKKDGSKIKIADDQRNYLSFDCNEQNDEKHIEKYGDNTKNNAKNVEILNYFKDLLEDKKEEIFENNKTGKNNDKSISANYTVTGLLRDTNNEDDDEKDKPIYFRPTISKSFSLEYKGEPLDAINNSNVNKAIFPKLKPGEAPKRGEDLKAFKNSLEVVIFWPQGSQEKIKIKFTDLVEAKKPTIEIIYREVETDENIKKPNEFSNEDLEDSEKLKEFNKLYGEPQIMTLDSIEKMEQYFKSAYYRIIFTVSELSVETGLAKSTDKKKFGFKAYCKGIDIIMIRGKKSNVENTFKNNLIGKMYKSMAFNTKKVENNVEIVNKKIENKSEKSDEVISNSDDDEYEIEEVEVSDSGSEEEEIVVKKPTTLKKK